MSPVFYNHNYEDAVLWRVFQHVRKGCYINVGGGNFLVSLAAKIFYNKGWKAINIAPDRVLFEGLQSARPNDINLQLAAGERKGALDIYEREGTDLSDMDKSNVNITAKNTVIQYTVPVVRLTTVCEQHAEGEIHFLKIGMREDVFSVLKGLDLTKVRPWLILVEVDLHKEEKASSNAWPPLLLERGYHQPFFDGQYQYYVADEHPEIDDALAEPIANGFSQEKEAMERLHSLVEAKKIELESLLPSLAKMDKSREELLRKIDYLQNKVNSLNEKHQGNWEESQALLRIIVEKDTILRENKVMLIEHEREVEQLKEQHHKMESTFAGERELLKEEGILLKQEKGLLDDRVKELYSQVDLQKRALEAAHAQAFSALEVVRAEAAAGLAIAHAEIARQQLDVNMLRAIYKSKSWKITLPLRKCMLGMKVALTYPQQLAGWIIRFPKRAIRWSVVRLMALSLKFPRIKNLFRIGLKRFPRVYQKLVLLAQARGLVASPASTPQIHAELVPASPLLEAETGGDFPEPENVASEKGEPLLQIGRSASQIYQQLNAEVMQENKRSS